MVIWSNRSKPWKRSLPAARATSGGGRDIGGLVAMDPHSGRVLAMAGGFSFAESQFNRATQATRQPGSSFKPFVYAAALDSGFTPATILIDAPIEVEVGGGEVWRPRNASNQFYGPTPLRTGIERSRNLMTVRLAQELGMAQVAGYAERFGVYDRMGQFLANSLGSEETTLYRMVAAYSMFANGGERVEPTLIDRVQDRWGTTVYRHDQRSFDEGGVREVLPGALPRITQLGTGEIGGKAAGLAFLRDEVVAALEPVSPVGGRHDRRVVPGGDGVEAEQVGPLREPGELHRSVALDARVRGDPRRVLTDVGLDDVGVEVVAEVEHQVVDVELLGQLVQVGLG